MLSYTFKEGDPSAPTVLYLHGLGIGGWCWEPVTSALPEFGALVPDLPGHGGSASIEWQSIYETAAKVAEILDTRPVATPIHLTGHSLGAYVGLSLLIQRPELFKSAMLSGFHVGAINYSTLFKLAYVLNGAMFSVSFLLRRFASVFGDAIAAERFIEGAKAIRPRTIRRAGIQVVDFKTPLGTEKLTMPITAVAATGEPAAIRNMPRWFENHAPNARGHLLEDRDHLWPIKEPEFYAELLKEHIAGVE